MNLTEAFLAMRNNQLVQHFTTGEKYFVHSVENLGVFLRREDKKGGFLWVKFDHIKQWGLDEPINTLPLDQDLDVFTCTALDKGTFYQCWDDEVEHREIDLVCPPESDMYAIVLESLFGDDSLEDNIKYYISKYLDEKGY